MQPQRPTRHVVISNRVQCLLNPLERFAHYAKEFFSRWSQRQSTSVTFKQLLAQQVFKSADMAAHRALRHRKRGGSASEAQVTADRLERSQRIER